MDQFEKFEKQLISSYETALAEESKEIDEKVNSLIKNYKDLNVDDLYYKIKKFNYNVSNLKSIKYDLDNISETRKNQKKSLKES